MEKGKDTLFGGVKDKISNYISKDLFEVNDKGWQDKQKQAIYSLSDVSADFSIDLALSGPFALMKGAKNLGKANKKFDESLKENNVNSDTIANSNAELKSNEHSLNNKNGSDGVGIAETGIKATGENPLNKANEAQKVDKVTKVADNKDIDKILENAEKGRKTSTKLIQYKKEGGYKQAEKDFEALGVKNIKTVEKSDGSLVKIGELSDGRKVNIRTKSTYGSEATLEIQGKEPIKIRYN